MLKTLQKCFVRISAIYFPQKLSSTRLFALISIVCLSATVNAQQMAKKENVSSVLSDEFISGSWSGKGMDIINFGFKDSINDGHWYQMDFKLIPEPRGRVRMEGSVSVLKKADPSKITMTRKLKGEGVRDGDFMKLDYVFIPEPADPTSGFGMMLYKFSRPDNSAAGFYVSKSFITGELVNGKFNLVKSQ